MPLMRGLAARPGLPGDGHQSRRFIRVSRTDTAAVSWATPETPFPVFPNRARCGVSAQSDHKLRKDSFATEAPPFRNVDRNILVEGLPGPSLDVSASWKESRPSLHLILDFNGAQNLTGH